MSEIQRRQQTEVLAYAGIALALSVVSLMIFRGPVSIVSTFIVPAVVAIFARKKLFPYYLLTSMGLLIMTFVFFITQIIFVIGYILLSIALKILFIDSEINIKVGWQGFLIYTLLVIVVLFMGIQLTQTVLSIPLHDMMLRMSNHRYSIYFAILLLESIAITLINFLIIKVLIPRIRL